MGKLWGALVLVAPIAAFSVWAFLQQSEQIETRADAHEARFELDRSRLEREFESRRPRGKQSAEYKDAQARVEAAERKVAEMEAAKTAARKPMQEGAKDVDAALKAWENAESQKGESK